MCKYIYSLNTNKYTESASTNKYKHAIKEHNNTDEVDNLDKGNNTLYYLATISQLSKLFIYEWMNPKNSLFKQK